MGCLFAATPLALAIVDAVDQQILYATSAYADLHGYSVDEVIGRPVADMHAPDGHGELQAHLRRVTRERAITVRVRHARKDGSIFPARIDARAMTDAAGHVRYWAVTAEDLTELEATAEAKRGWPPLSSRRTTPSSASRSTVPSRVGMARLNGCSATPSGAARVGRLHGHSQLVRGAGDPRRQHHRDGAGAGGGQPSSRRDRDPAGGRHDSRHVPHDGQRHGKPDAGGSPP